MDITLTIMQEIKFTLTIDEANMILNAIQELPAKLANPLTQKLQAQAKEQLEPAEPAAE